MTECICGCANQTRGGRFLPGHDAKLKSRLLKEATGNDQVKSQVATEQLEQLGWTKFLAKRQEVLANRVATKPRARKAGRNSDWLYALKAAQRVLRWCGQYSSQSSNQIEINADNAVEIATLRHPDLIIPEGEPPKFTAQEQAALEALKCL